jgi:hypothetical protein
MSVIAIPKPLREKLGDDGVDALLAVFSEVSLYTRNDLATKSDIKEMATKSDTKDMSAKSDLKELRQEMATKSDIKEMATKSDIKEMATKSDLKELRQEMATKDDLDKLRFELKSEIDKSKVDSVRWMLAFWASQIGILIAAMAVMLKFFIK